MTDMNDLDDIVEMTEEIPKEMIEKDERAKRKINTVINLSDPQPGMLFGFFEDEVWRVVNYLPYPRPGQYNRGLLIVSKKNGKALYAIPQRMNGNLERSTVSRVSESHMLQLMKRYTQPFDEERPFEAHVIAGLIDVTNDELAWFVEDDGTVQFSYSVADEAEYESKLPVVRSAVRHIGGKFIESRCSATLVLGDDDDYKKPDYGGWHHIKIEPLDATPTPDETVMNDE